MSKKNLLEPLFLNKKSHFSYTLLRHYKAGIVLEGSEVKSIRMGKVHLKESYCFFQAHQLWVKGLYIGPYHPAAQEDYQPTRLRKLLLTRRELRRMEAEKINLGATIVICKLFFDANHRVKLDIALAKGKKLHDKRATIKARDVARNLQKQNIDQV